MIRAGPPYALPWVRVLFTPRAPPDRWPRRVSLVQWRDRAYAVPAAVDAAIFRIQGALTRATGLPGHFVAVLPPVARIIPRLAAAGWPLAALTVVEPDAALAALLAAVDPAGCAAFIAEARGLVG